jgi:hypothetical protein
MKFEGGQIQQLLPIKAICGHGSGRVGEGRLRKSHNGIKWSTFFGLLDICFYYSGRSSAPPVPDMIFLIPIVKTDKRTEQRKSNKVAKHVLKSL